MCWPKALFKFLAHLKNKTFWHPKKITSRVSYFVREPKGFEPSRLAHCVSTPPKQGGPGLHQIFWAYGQWYALPYTILLTIDHKSLCGHMGTYTTSARPSLDGPTVHPATVMTIGNKYHPRQVGFYTTCGWCSNTLRRGLQCCTTTSTLEAHGWWLPCVRRLGCTNEPFVPSSVSSGTPLTIASSQLVMSSCMSIGPQHDASRRRHVTQSSACPKGGNNPATRCPRGYNVTWPCRIRRAT